MAGFEDRCDLRIHVYKHVLLSLDLVISLLHLRLDPFRELVTNDGIDDIRDVLSGKFLYLFLDGEVLFNPWILLAEALHVFYGQALELGHVDMLDVSTLDALLGPRLDITEMPNRDILEWRKIDVDLRS